MNAGARCAVAAARLLQALSLAAAAARLPVRADVLGLRAGGDRPPRPRPRGAGSPSAASCAATRSIGAASTPFPERDVSQDGKTPSRRRRTLAARPARSGSGSAPSRPSASRRWSQRPRRLPPRRRPRVARPPIAANATAAARSGRPAGRRQRRSRDADDRFQRRLQGHVLQPRSGALVLRPDRTFRRAEAAARAAAQAAAGASAAARPRFRRGRRHDEEGRRRRSSSSSASRTASCAGATPMRRSPSSRRSASGRATSSTSRSPSRDRPTACSSGPACAIPTEAERGSRYVMAATAVGATVERDEDRFGREGVGQERLGDARRRALPASRTTTSSRSSCPNAPSTARLFSFSLPRPEGKPSVEIAAGVGAQGAFDGVGLLRPEGRRRFSRATTSAWSARSTSAGTGSSRGRCCGC